MNKNWIKFSEQKPDISKKYLCFWNVGGKWNGFAIFLWKDNEWSHDWGQKGTWTKSVTHYQELEEPNE